MRTFSFTSDGPGTVSAEVTSTAPMDSSMMCLTVDGSPTVCDSEAAPGFTRPATTAHSHWTFTLSSASEASPTVDVQFKWPSENPSISLDHARFQGSPNPDSLRMFKATFTTRAAGTLSVDAAWPPAAVNATLTVTDESGSRPTAVGAAKYSGQGAISPTYSHALRAHRTYTVTLFNDSPDSGRPDLKATLAFP